MFRKLILVLGATAVIGAAALSPTAASAHHWHHSHGWYAGVSPVYYGPDCYTVQQVYWRHGYKHVRYVRVCD